MLTPQQLLTVLGANVRTAKEQTIRAYNTDTRTEHIRYLDGKVAAFDEVLRLFAIVRTPPEDPNG